MQSLVFLCLILLSPALKADVDQRLPNGQLAYYGQEFYTAFSKKTDVSKDIIFKVFNSNHSSSNGKLDTLSSSCSSNCYRHSSVGYSRAREILFGQLFIKKDREGNFVEDVYCAKKFHFRAVGEISNMSRLVNIEHTWPQSKFSTSFDKILQKSDMHHLYPTDSDANNRRANHEFGEIGSNVDELNVEDCSISQLASVSGRDTFSPPITHRGNVARSLFYFAIRYKMVIHPTQEKFLRKWHKADPVDQAERDRHEVISGYQKVRNPFVDYPELADQITDF